MMTRQELMRFYTLRKLGLDRDFAAQKAVESIELFPSAEDFFRAVHQIKDRNDKIGHKSQSLNQEGE